ncbi:MAG: hypothetical protein JWP46_2357 [Modestobacter sp.]|nr:hypothetical protein [Modestobacter sp.]
MTPDGPTSRRLVLLPLAAVLAAVVAVAAVIAGVVAGQRDRAGTAEPGPAAH